MTESHTPGPWAWNRNYNGLEGDCSVDVLHYEPYEGMWLSHENSKANARLIAAAPELLAALQEAYRWSNDCPDDVLIQVREAIAKATGA